MAILRAHDLVKIFGKKQVVKGITIQVKDGEVVGLLGPNGAGKTTTFYMLVGIIRPNGGSVFIGDKEITHWPLHRRAKNGISYLPQESSIFKKLTVRQNLMIILEYTGLSKKKRNEKADLLLDQLGISRLADQKAAFLSGGERRRLEIARALIQEPTFILLDEPFAGIDPLAVEDIQQIIRSLRKLGIGVLISDHNVRETLNICDRASIVYDGQIILEGTPGQIVDDPKARQIYLGEDFRL
jgi:lipopolysaccharide export system ATP-binding protein